MSTDAPQIEGKKEDKQPSEASTQLAKAGGQVAVQRPKAPALVADDITAALFADLSPEEIAEAQKSIDEANLANINDGDIKVSRLSIAQALTPEVSERLPGWIPSVLFDSMSKEIYSRPAKQPWLEDKGIDGRTLQCLPVLFIFKLPSEYVKWPTKEEKKDGMKGFHWKETDIEVPRVREGLWRPKGTWKGEGAPPVTEHTNILTLPLFKNEEGFMEPLGNPIIVSASRTSSKCGQQIVQSCDAHRITRMPNQMPLPWYGRIYYLYTETEKFASGSCEVLKVAKSKLIYEKGLFELQTLQNVFSSLFKLSMELAKPGTGREMQEMYLNVAQFSDDDDADPVSSDASGSSEMSSDDPSF